MGRILAGPRAGTRQGPTLSAPAASPASLPRRGGGGPRAPSSGEGDAKSSSCVSCSSADSGAARSATCDSGNAGAPPGGVVPPLSPAYVHVLLAVFATTRRLSTYT